MRTSAEISRKIQIITLIVVVITAFITTFTGSAFNLSIPGISDEFGVSAGSAGWLITGYTLAVAAFSVPMGRLADATCMKHVLAAGIAVFFMCCTAAVLVDSFPVLMTVRMIQGIGAAMIFSTNVAVLIKAFPAKKRGQVLGYSLASTYAGLSAGPVAGGMLNHAFGWRSIFVFTGVLGAAALIITIFGLSADIKNEQEERRSLDVKGNLLYLIFIILFMYGASEILAGPVPVICAAAGLVSGILFVIYESRTDDPAVDISLFRKNAGYACSNLAALMNYGATFAISYLMSVYLQVVMGYDSASAGLIMISQPLVMAVLTPVMGRFSDRFSPFRMSSLGMAFCAAGTFMFIFAGNVNSLIFIIAALVITGLGFALFSSPNTNAVMSSVSREYYGVASSLLATMRSIGHTLSMVIVTITVNINMPGLSLFQADPDTISDVVKISFIIFTIICIAGVFVSLKRKIDK